MNHKDIDKHFLRSIIGDDADLPPENRQVLTMAEARKIAKDAERKDVLRPNIGSGDTKTSKSGSFHGTGWTTEGEQECRPGIM